MDLKDLTIEALRGKKVAVHCKTQEEFKAVTDILGYVWKKTTWHQHKEHSCISISEVKNNKTSFYKTIWKYTIIPAADFIAANKKEVVTELSFLSQITSIKFGCVTDGDYEYLSITTSNRKDNQLSAVISKEQILALRDFLNQLP